MQAADSLLQDTRFSALFSDREYQIDRQSEQWRLLNPALEKIHEAKEQRWQSLKKQRDSSASDDGDGNVIDEEGIGAANERVRHL